MGYQPQRRLRAVSALTDDILSPAGGQSDALLGHPRSVRWTFRGQAHEDQSTDWSHGGAVTSLRPRKRSKTNTGASVSWCRCCAVGYADHTVRCVSVAYALVYSGRTET